MPYLVAAVVAAVVGGIEQYRRLVARFTLENKAGLWWLLRIVLEVGVGLLAVGIIRAAHIAGWNHAWGWIAAGAAGPAVVRLRVLELGKDGPPVGPATLYEPLRRLLEDQIDGRSAECQTTWLNYEILPALSRAGPTPTQLATYAIDYLNSLPRMDQSIRALEIAWFEGIRDSGSVSDRVKLETMARHLVIDLKAHRLLQRFVRDHAGA